MKEIIITTLSVFLCTSCINTDWENVKNDQLIIYGNHVSSYYNESRSNMLLENGEQISFFSQKGIIANGEILTLNNNYWYGENKLNWSENDNSAYVNAYNPPLPTSFDVLYSPDGQLCDLLIAQGEYSPNSTIKLQFKHFFSRIIFSIENRLNNELAELNIECSHKITEINPYNGQIVTKEMPKRAENQSVIHLKQNVSGVYSIIVPPEENQSITIYIKTKNGNTLQKEIQNINCVRNQSYNFKVKEKSNTIGIFTAEDFIAFTHLINNKKYPNRNLNDFGTTINGETTYYLKGDISFSEEEKKNIQQIGTTSAFKDTFDGQGFTLYNLDIPMGANKGTGLFTSIDMHGVVKNLNIVNATIPHQSKNEYSGILCGNNSGLIMNCKIKDCSIHLMEKKVGGLVGKNEGVILNCDVDALKVSVSTTVNNASCSFGALACLNGNTGQILNCRLVHLTKSDKTPIGFLSAISNINNNLQTNCLSDYCDACFHPFCNIKRKMPDHCYYHSDMSPQVKKDPELKGKNLGDYNIYTFSHNDVDMPKIVNALNKWIDFEGKKQYPNYKFRRWKLEPNRVISFE